jgi:hypothetical protein
MLLNQYVGELPENIDFSSFEKSVRDDCRKAHLSTDSIKMKNREGLLTVSCTGDVANIIRKRKDVLRFRCDKIGNVGEKESK